jgi:hypothetical protein
MQRCVDPLVGNLAKLGVAEDGFATVGRFLSFYFDPTAEVSFGQSFSCLEEGHQHVVYRREMANSGFRDVSQLIRSSSAAIHHSQYT